MPWIRRNLRGTKVYARTKADGSLDTDASGRVDVKYKLDEDAKLYRALAANLTGTGDKADDEPQPDVERHPVAHEKIAPDAIVVYTDGACTGNPGPMGIGVVIIADGKRKEISEYLGHGTNNIAELTAIERALDVLADHADRTVLIHADSSYAIGLMASGWKAKANQELVERMRKKSRRFPKLRFVKVAGHAGVPENERCDELARAAVVRGK